MRKRAGTLRHYRLRLDALEERSLLSALTVLSAGSLPSTVIVEKGPPISAGMPAWTGPGWHGGMAHTNSLAAEPVGRWMSDVAEGNTTGAGLWPYGAPTEEPQPFVANTSGPAGGPRLLVTAVSGRGSLGGHSFRSSASASFADAAEAAGMPGDTSAHVSEPAPAPDGAVSVVAQPAVVGVGSYATGSVLALLTTSHVAVDMMVLPEVRIGPAPGPPMHANTDPSAEDHPDPNAGHDPTADVEVQAYQPVLHAQNAFGASTVDASPADRDGRDPSLVASSNGAGPGPALALRVRTTAGQESGGALGLESSATRLAVPSSGVPNPNGEGVVVVSGPAAGGSQAAVSAVNAGPGDAPPGQAAGGATQVDGESPRAHGLGLIDNVLPFDRDTVAAAIDRFFDRFDQSGADMDEEREPAALTPPPGALLFALAATEAARRHFKRKREEDAAARPRRRVVEGLGFEEAFGSSSPWSSRLS